MNILIPAWEECNWEKVKENWEALNHSVILYLEEAHDRWQDPRFRSVLRRFIRETQIDIIFSINYYPILSRACQETGIAYICWCPTLSSEDIPPNLLQYQKNYYFLFDRQEINNLQQTGVINAFYMPYALDFPEQIDAYKNMMQSGIETASPYAEGYLNGLLQVKEHMKQYEKRLSSDKYPDFYNNYLKMHSLKTRLGNIIDCCFKTLECV